MKLKFLPTLTLKLKSFFRRESAHQNETPTDTSLKITERVASEAKAMPAMANAGMPELYDTGDDCACLLYKNVTLSNFEAYEAELANAGYAKYECHDVLRSDNRYAQYYNDVHSVTLFYSAFESRITVFAEPIEKTGLVSSAKQSYTPISNYEPKLLQIGATDPVANDGGTIGENGEYIVSVENHKLGESRYSGMCYIFRLEDGRFIVYDGGHSDIKLPEHNAQNARRIYEKMKELAGEGNDITVAAWLVTHAHSDHFDALHAFESMGLSKKVKVERLIINIPTESQLSPNSKGKTGAGNLVAHRATANALRACGTTVYKAHPGQIFRFANVELQILFTHDMRVDERLDSFNSTSIVSRLVIEHNGATVGTVILTGDAYAPCTDKMLNAYGAALKSDALQVPHHGYYRGNDGKTSQYNFYRTVEPSFVLWPCAEERTYSIEHANDPDTDKKLHGHVRVLAQNAQNNHNKWILENLNGWKVDTENNTVVCTTDKTEGYISEGDNEIFFAFFDTVTFTFGVTNGQNVNDIHYERVKNVKYEGAVT